MYPWIYLISKMLRLIILLAISLLGVNGFPKYQNSIPNGNKVPNPCNPEDIWPGVGHELVGGSGTRNSFGLDFLSSNTTWTKELCEKDSDGDGISNGAELGDPNCTWTANSIPKSTPLSHPGVCEPVHSAKCMDRNSWLKCPKNFSCPDFQKKSTKSMNLFLPKTTVPAQETTYMCYGFKMPNDTKYHEIGLIPYIDNTEIMHHMLVFGCSKPPKTELLTNATQCTMGLEGCTTIIGLWSVGIYGECHPDQYGFPIGVSGYQYLVVQLHWNNPQLKSGMTDGSGVTIYYTDQLRPNDAMVIMTGQQYLEIPPQRESVKFEGTCKASCTKLLQPQKVNISAALLHMHYLGKAGGIQLIRDGVVTKVLARQDSYDYNTPVTNTYEPPIELKAGDEIKVLCEFESMSNNKTVYWGEGTQDEMCFGFITIYPAVPNFDFCGEFENAAVCTLPTFNLFQENNCNLADFYSLLPPITNYCTFGNCSRVCKVLMKGLYNTGCIDNSMWKFIKKFNFLFGPEIGSKIGLIDNCWQAVVNETSSTPMAPNTTTIIPTTTISSVTTSSNSSLPGNCNPYTSKAHAAGVAYLLFVLSLLSVYFS